MTFNCAECGRTQSEPLDLDKTGNAVCWNCGRSPYSDLPPTPSDRVTDPRTAPPARGFLSRFFRRGDPGAPPDGTAPEAPPPDPAPAPASSSQSSAAAPFEKQPEFTVSLTKIGADKIEVIKLVRDVTSLGLREAKDLVEGAPKAVKKGVTKDEAAAIKKKFEEVGATVSIADASGTLADVMPSLTLTQPSHSAEKTGESRATAERAQASVKLTINPQFDGARSFNEGLAAVRIGDDTTGKHGFIDETGHYVINPQFPSAESFSDGLAAVCITDGFWITWGFIDKTGNYAIKPKFDSAASFSDGLARVCISDGTTRKRLPASNAKWGFIDKTGHYVINPQFDDAGSFSEGLAAVRIGDDETGKWGYIDKTGRIVINPQFDSAIEFSEGLGRVSIDEVNPNAVFDEDGDRVLDTDSPHWLEPDSMSKFGFIDRTGHSVIIPKFDRAGAFSDGLAWVSIGDDETGKYGFIDKTGHFVINPPFNFAQSFSDGLAAVRIGDDETGKWGYIDKTGRIVINPQFDDAGSFREGLAWVSIGDDETGKYGFIDKTGHFVIIPKFRLAGSFCGGLAMVFIGDKWGYTSILEMSQ